MNPQETQHQQQSGPTCITRQVVVSSFLGHRAGRGWIILDSFFFFFWHNLSVLTSVLCAVFNTHQTERYEIPFCLVAWGVIKPAANLKSVLSAYLTSDVFSGVSPEFLSSILAAFERWRTSCLCVVTQAFSLSKVQEANHLRSSVSILTFNTFQFVSLRMSHSSSWTLKSKHFVFSCHQLPVLAMDKRVTLWTPKLTYRSPAHLTFCLWYAHFLFGE